MKTDTPTIISAMRHLAATVQSDDGIANAAIAEAGDRLEELHAEKAAIVAELERLEAGWWKKSSDSTELRAKAFACGLASAFSLAIQAVQAGGALPPESLSE